MRVGGEPRHQRPPVPQQAVRRGRIEEVGVVLQGGGEPFGGPHHAQREVEFGRPGRQRLQGHVHLAQPLDGERLLELEDRLEERMAPQPPLRPQLLHQALEGDVLVGVGPQADLAHPRQQLPQIRVAVHRRAQRQHVDEQADHPLDLGAGPIGHGGADRHRGRAGVACELGLEGGEQQHERRHPLAPGQPLQLQGERRRQRGRARAAPPRARHGPRPVGRQLQVRRAGQPLAPPRGLGLQQLAAQPLALPDGPVGVLHGRLGERRGAAGGQRLVEGGQLGQEDAERPAVGHDVMEDQHQLVLVRRQPQGQGAPEGAPREVERRQGRRAGQPLRLIRRAPGRQG